VAGKSTLNAKNLEALGVERLAELLVEISMGNAAAKRRLRLELAGAANPADLAKEIRKRLATIARSKSFVDWQNRRRLIDDLEAQRSAILDKVAKIDADEAYDLMWRFMALAESVYGRCDDSSGHVGDIFRAACTNLGELAQLAKPTPEKVADQIFEVLPQNGYGQYDQLIGTLAPVLGYKGLERLKKRVIELSKGKSKKPADKARREIAFCSGGPVYEDDVQEHIRESTIRLALMAIADAEGDVDAFIAQYEPETRKVPMVAAEIGGRLTAAGRAKEALKILEAAEQQRDWIVFEWENARIDALETLGRSGEAQEARWSCFEKSLSPDHLRAYIQRLPDFEDEEAEARAMDYACRIKSLHDALAFFVIWPAIDRAAQVTIERSDELNGDRYEVLTPAAEALTGKYPLAATVTLRAMIDFSLTHARSSRYRYAARHLMMCSSLAANIDDYQKFESHDAYLGRLKKAHGRKSGFWDFVKE
jgi:hypothetical protein